jgi:hypothetical protein
MTTPDKKMIAILDYCSLRDKKPRPVTPELLEHLDEAWAFNHLAERYFRADYDEIRQIVAEHNDLKRQLKEQTARADVAELHGDEFAIDYERERARVRRLREAISDSNGILKSMLGSEANEGGVIGDQLIDNKAALAETEPTCKPDLHVQPRLVSKCCGAGVFTKPITGIVHCNDCGLPCDVKEDGHE